MTACPSGAKPLTTVRRIAGRAGIVLVAEIWLTASLTMSAVDVFAAERAENARRQPEPVSEESLNDFRTLLELGVRPDRKRVTEAATLFEKLQRRNPEDPRVEYAYALVLGRLAQPVESRKHLEVAANHTRYFRAEQLLIRDLIKAKQFPAAGERLSDLARELSTDDPAAPAAAQWMGRIVACVVGPVGTKDAREQFAYLHLHLRMHLPAVLVTAYDKGFHHLELEVDDLRSSIELVQMQAETVSDAAKESADEALAKKRGDLLVKEGAAKEAGKKWEEWLADETGKVDESLIEMEKRFQDLENSATVQQAAVTALRLQLDRIDRGLDGSGVFIPGQGLGVSQVNAPRRGDVATLLMLEESKLGLIWAAQQELSNLAGAQLASRKNIVAQYQQATGTILNELDSLKKWDQRAKKIAEREKRDADKKPAGISSLEARVKSLSTYDPFDFKIERERLLAELGSPEPPTVE
jgi:hypothetical protein